MLWTVVICLGRTMYVPTIFSMQMKSKEHDVFRLLMFEMFSLLHYFVHIVFRIFEIIHIHSSLCNTPVRFTLKTNYLCHSFSIHIPYHTTGEVQHTQCSMVIFGQDEGKELHNHRLSHHDLRSGFIVVSVARSAVVFFQILSPVVLLFCSQFLSFYGHW